MGGKAEIVQVHTIAKRHVKGKKPPSWKTSARQCSVLPPGFPTAAVETQGLTAEQQSGDSG